MPVYVDPLFEYGTRPWWPYTHACHMMADTEVELHAFAAKLGLERAWHQPCPPHSVSHYDLNDTKRKQAVRLGAIECELGDLYGVMEDRMRKLARNLRPKPAEPAMPPDPEWQL